MDKYLVGGFNPSEKYEFVSWDDDIPNWMERHKIHVPNHQPDDVRVGVVCRMTFSFVAWHVLAVCQNQ